MTQIVLDALERAAAAHGVHEETELGGVYDEEWPQWYAEHMSRTLGEEGHPLSVDVVRDALERAAAAHGVHEATDLGGVRDEQWPQWYAEHMTQTLTEGGHAFG